MILRVWVALVLVLISSPLFAQSVEERLARLEQEVRELRAENEELRKQLGVTPPPKPVATPQVQPAGNESQLQIGGFIQAQAEAGGQIDYRYGDDNDRIFVRRARVNVQGSFAEDFDFKAEMDLGGGQGSTSGVRAQGTDVYVQWSGNPFAQVRAGQFKTPYGYEQLYSDTKLLTIERTLGSDRIGMSRQVGVQLSGQAANIEYAIGAFNGNGTNISFNDDEGFVTAARVSGTLWSRGDVSRVTAGVNGYVSEDGAAPVAPELGFTGNTFAGKRRAWGADAQLLHGPIEVWGELLRARFEPDEPGPARELRSWYLAAGYSITPKLQAVAMIDTFDGVTDNVRTWIIGGSYFIKGDDLKLQLNLMRTDEEETRVSARLQTMF
jgi:hypothetical protein